MLDPQSHSGRRLAAGLFSLGMLAFVSGCQSDGEGETTGGDSAKPAPVTQTELRAYCPPVVLREGTTFFNSFEKGADGDRTKLIYQTSIFDATRSCTRSDGTLSVKVAVAGRVVPGPLGKTGSVTVPIRIAVTNGDEVLYSQLHQYSVQVASTGQATQFLFTDPAVTFPDAGRGVRIFAGFDEGPAKKQADPTE